MKTVFILHHSYELDDQDETKLIGTYSTKEQAELAITRLKDKNGFKYHPDAFVISEYELDKTAHPKKAAKSSDRPDSAPHMKALRRFPVA